MFTIASSPDSSIYVQSKTPYPNHSVSIRGEKGVWLVQPGTAVNSPGDIWRVIHSAGTWSQSGNSF